LRGFTTALAVLLGLGLCLCSAAARLYAGGGHVRGVVTDESKGVLPGVTVVAADAAGRVLATAVTDGAGRYVIGPLAPDRLTLTFQLEGFSTAAVRAEIAAERDAVVSPCLTLAPQSETVVVIGKIVTPPPPPPVAPPPPPRPRPVTRAVPEHDPASVCGPALLTETPESFGTVRARRYAANELYAKDDELVIDGGTLGGIEVGRNFVVRRSYAVELDSRAATAEHTAGLVQIVAADEQTAIAVVMYACDEIMPGDRLASFHPEPLRAPSRGGSPDYRHAARVLFPDLGQLLGAPKRLMVIDHGAAFGIRAGQRMTLFRRREWDRGAPFTIGEAVVVAVRFDSATIRVERVTDAIAAGDWAAPQR
jgi:hypothetical protein